MELSFEIFFTNEILR